MFRLLGALEERIAYEQTHEFYLSAPAGIRFEFSDAMELGFQCPETGAPLEPMENDQMVAAMEQRIEALRAELNADVVDAA
jgi:Transcription factor IIE (TFIIE), alpha subunit